ncbi:MAG: hypothetical protein KA383_13680 [Phycisphaerae bacterium]|nr:hypothetical protein [Phycisphaerae bacterium]
MSDRRLVRQLAREWLVTLLALALVIAPFGCQIQSIIDGGSDNTDGDSLDTHTAGMFLNEDTSDPLMVAGRNAAGDAFYVYGARAVGGAVGEVESILIRTAAGQEALIVFELGRPVYLEGPDGSYARITYNEVSLQRLQATVVVYDAVTQTTETAEAEVDLQKTATEVAALVESVTGRTLELPTAPADTAKLSQRALGPLLQVLLVVPMLALSHLMIVIMGQLMTAVFAAVTVAFQAAVVAAFWPLFMFAALLGEVTIRVESVPLLDIFIELPPPPDIRVIIK